MISLEKDVRDYIKRNVPTKEKLSEYSAQVITMNILFGYSPIEENCGDPSDLTDEDGDYYDEIYSYVMKIKKEEGVL